MQHTVTDIFFALLRYSLVDPSSRTMSRDLPITEPLGEEQWRQIFALSKKQALVGVIYSGVQRLPEHLQPSQELMDKWSNVVLRIMASNSFMNGTAAKITRMFAERGRRTLILKGQANALLYPDPYVRQAGDIDILVEGGRKSVLKLLNEMGLMEGVNIYDVSTIHVHLNSNKFSNVIPAPSQNVIPAPEPGPPTRKGVSVEVHFAPTYNNSPFTTRTMCEFLSQQIAIPGAVQLSAQGFNCPPMTFALVMQLSHLLRHFFGEGIGLRQLADYHQLLIHSTEADRSLVRANLKKMGLYHIAGATMHVMETIFKMPREQLLCEPDKIRGEQLYENILAGGNFGQYSRESKLPTVKRWLADRVRPLHRLTFDITEALWHECRYIVMFMRYMPKRIKYRKFSVRKV